MNTIYAFLRLALRQGTVACPYRGPALVREGAFMYTNQSEGTLEAFWGHERITDHAQPVYDLHYSGGVLR